MAIAPAPLLLSPTPAAPSKGNRPTSREGGDTGFAATMAREVQGRSPQPDAAAGPDASAQRQDIGANQAAPALPAPAAPGGASDQASQEAPAGLPADDAGGAGGAGGAVTPKAAMPEAEPTASRQNDAKLDRHARMATSPPARRASTHLGPKPAMPAPPMAAPPTGSEAPLEGSAPTKTPLRARTRVEVPEDPTAPLPADLALLAKPLPVDPAVMAQLNLTRANDLAPAATADAAPQALASTVAPDEPWLALAGASADSTALVGAAPPDRPVARATADATLTDAAGRAAPANSLTLADAQAAASQDLPLPAAAQGLDAGPSAAASVTSSHAAPAATAMANGAATALAASAAATAPSAQTVSASPRSPTNTPIGRGAPPRAEAGAVQPQEPPAQDLGAALGVADTTPPQRRPTPAETSEDASPQRLATPTAPADTATLPGPVPVSVPSTGLPAQANAAPATAGRDATPVDMARRDTAAAARAQEGASNNPGIFAAIHVNAATSGATAAAPTAMADGTAGTAPRRPAGLQRSSADNTATPPETNAATGPTAVAQPLFAAASDNSAAGQVAQALQLASPATASPAPRGSEATGVRQASIDVPIDQPGFAPALGAQISLMARDGVQEARLQLHPAEMGPITVQIAVSGTAARVDFQAEMAATRSAIEASLPALAGALQDAGLTLTGGGVFQQSPQGGQPHPEQSGRGAPTTGARRDARSAAASLDTPPVRLAGGRRGLVDLVA